MRRDMRVSRWTLLVALGLASLAADSALAQGDPLEYAVKATYLYKLPEFVSWPPGALPPNAFVLCVIGRDPVADLLDQAVKGQTVQDRPVTVQRYDSIGANPGCQLMYIATSAAASAAGVLAQLRGMPVLTVTDGQTRPGATGMINFVLIAGHVRFEIDREAAAMAKLEISSKLLTLAVRALQ